MEPIAPAAPAPPTPETPVAPPTVSATRAAAEAGDFAAFDTAHQAARRGTPLPRVETPDASAPDAKTDTPANLSPDPSTPTTPERQLSKRQQDINDRAQRAVDAATADLRAENARLKAELAAPRRESAPVAPVPTAAPVPDTPAWQRYAALPSAPKLDESNSIEEYTAKMALFIADTRHDERIAADRQQHDKNNRVQELTNLGQQYGERLRAASAADPELVVYEDGEIVRSKIDRALLAARPISGLTDEERGPNDSKVTFANAVAEAGLYSDDPARLFLHLSTHRDDTMRIAQLPNLQSVARALAHLDGKLSAGAPAAPAPAESSTAAARAAPTSSITAAPPPPQTVSRTGATSDPKAAALAQGDFATFDRLEMARKRAERGVPA